MSTVEMDDSRQTDTHQCDACARTPRRQKRSNAPKKADDELCKFWREKVPGIKTDWKFWQAELVQSFDFTAKSSLQKASLQLDRLLFDFPPTYVPFSLLFVA